jgi:hypothetical protein
MESESPEPVGIRVLKALSEALGPDATRADFCRMISRVEDDLRRKVDSAMFAKDYTAADRHVDELVFLARLKPEMCPAR